MLARRQADLLIKCHSRLWGRAFSRPLPAAAGDKQIARRGQDGRGARGGHRPAPGVGSSSATMPAASPSSSGPSSAPTTVTSTISTVSGGRRVMTYATHADLLRRFPWLARLPPPNAARVKKRQQRSLTSVKNTAATFMAKGAFRWNCDCFQLRTRRWDNREWKQPALKWRVSVLVTKRVIRNAVERNAVRRKLKSIIRRAISEAPTGYDYTFVPNNAIADADNRRLAERVSMAFSRVPRHGKR